MSAAAAVIGYSSFLPARSPSSQGPSCCRSCCGHRSAGPSGRSPNAPAGMACRLSWPRRRSSAPGPGALCARHRMPAPLSSWIGRRAELQAIFKDPAERAAAAAQRPGDRPSGPGSGGRSARCSRALLLVVVIVGRISFPLPSFELPAAAGARGEAFGFRSAGEMAITAQRPTSESAGGPHAAQPVLPQAPAPALAQHLRIRVAPLVKPPVSGIRCALALRRRST